MERAKHFGKWIVMTSGSFALIMLALAFTDVPYLAYHQLGTHCKPLKVNPSVIVVFGGSGMPSADGLMRSYFAAQAAIKFPISQIIIAHPYDQGRRKTIQLDLMKKELVMRGVDSLRISYEPLGHNTRSQSANLASMLEGRLSEPVLVITGPEHMYRSIRSLQKAGLKHVGGLSSFEKPISERKLKNRKHPEQEVGLSWRYNVWSYLKYELLVLREYSAIAYYKLMGWI
jgi:uncharacterized SAM-binding protein YcdF (DUF218 family)